MGLVLDVNGIKIKMHLEKCDDAQTGTVYFKHDISFSSDNWLNFNIDNGAERIFPSSIEEIAKALTEQADNKLTDVKEVICIELAMIFKLYPQTQAKDYYGNDNGDIQDIRTELQVYFWNDRLTANHLTVVLGRDEITKLRDYLVSALNG